MKQYFSFQWHITDECDQRCRHCYIFSGDACKKTDSMNWQQIQDTFDNCLDFCTTYDRICRELKTYGCKTYFNKKDHLWTLYEYETGAFKIPENAGDGMIYGGCNCGNCYITILPTGDILACRRAAGSKVGNVFKDRLADVWVCEMEAYRDYKKFEKCSKCELLAFCRGCPAVAKGTNGNFYAADPQCWKEVV